MTVDVFTHTALLGNPVAVVLGADGLSDAQMQAFARWTNLSETTFVLQPTPERWPRAPTTSCASSRLRASWLLPATPRWAAAMPGWPRAASRATPSRCCRNAKKAW
jgi:hypothetical protein